MVPLLVVTALLSPPGPQVQVMALDGDLQGPADRIRRELASDDRLRVNKELLVARPPRPSSLQAPKNALAEARGLYDALQVERALTILNTLQRELSQRLNEGPATTLLANTLRLKGLSLLYLERAEEAAQAFVTASFLMPGYAPDVAEWPPEARLAHADSVGATRRLPAGLLSLRVKPQNAGIWLDGRLLAEGSTTLSEVIPGEHLLMVTAPGHEPVAAVVDVAGDNKLNEASFFLEKLPDDRAKRDMIAHLAQSFGTDAEAGAAAGLLSFLSVDNLVVLAREPVDNAPVLAWVLDADGSRRGAGLNPASPLTTAPALASRVLGEELEPIDSEPWYSSWWFWGVSGGFLAVVGGTATYLLLSDTNDRVTIFVGRGQ